MNAASVGIQVAGQNLSNVNTDGYIRERVLLETATPYKPNGLTIGNGVQVGGVVQMIDRFLEERLRTSLSDANNSATQSNAYSQLETVLQELSTNDLSTSLSDFFNSIDNVLNQPENLSFRQMVAGQGTSLAKQINDMSQGILQMQIDVNRQVGDAAKQINELTSQIQGLNVEIARIEAGQPNGTQAVGLRDQRLVALSNLAQLVNIRTYEDGKTGIVSVFCGSDPLIVEGTRREVYVDYEGDTDSDLLTAFVHVKPSNNVLDATSGQLYGLYQGRDEILGGFAKQLDQFAHDLIDQFNRLYTSGQGLTGYDDLTSINAVSDASRPLNDAKLDYTPVNGAFSVLVKNKSTDKTTTTDVLVSLTTRQQNNDPFGINNSASAKGTSLNDLAEAINAIDGLKAVVTNDNRLQITSESDDIEFSFANDTSGMLAALGINVFFTGSDAKTIGVNSLMSDDPSKFAASQNGIGADTANALKLANMPETSAEELNNQSITQSYRNIYDSMIQKAGTTKSIATGNQTYYSALEAQKQSISGVNIDEETLQLITFQRAYQASAKYVTVINAMLESLINM